MSSLQSNIHQLWERALEASAAHHAPRSRRKPRPPPRDIRSTQDLVSCIETSGAEFADFRSSHGRLWGTLHTFATSLSSLTRIAVTPVSTLDFGFATSAVLGTLAHLILSSRKVSDSYDWIEQVLRTELRGIPSILEQILAAPPDSFVENKVICVLATVYHIIDHMHDLVQEGRFRRYLKVTFLDQDATTKDLIATLHRELAGQQSYLAAVTYNTTQRTHLVVREIDQSIKETTRIDRDTQLKQILCNGSALDDIQEIYARNRRDLIPGTCEWLMAEPSYQRWTSKDSRVLCILGGPGAGKTFLSTWIVRQSLERRGRNGDSQVAYFFVKEDNNNLRDANTILKTLAWQLASQDSDFKSHAASLCQDRTHTITAEETWHNIFFKYYLSEDCPPRGAVLIIDGLDEATPIARQTILRLFRAAELQSCATKAWLQLAVVGRSSLRGDAGYVGLRYSCLVEVSRLKNQSDINKYIQRMLQDVWVIQEIRKRPPDGEKKALRFGRVIFQKVSQGANGVFVWAKLLLDSIAHKDQRQIESILASPPSTLDDMIYSLFKRIAADDDIDRSLVQKMLLFVTYAKRPLSFGQLLLALSLPDMTPNYLLWAKTRGPLSSIFGLKFPRGVDPDVHSPQPSSPTATEPLNFFAAFDDDGDDSQGEGETVRQPPSGAHGLSMLSREVLAGVEDKSDDIRGEAILNELCRISSWEQRHTEISLCHAWIRDYLIREGKPETQRYGHLPIIPAAKDAPAELTIACLRTVRLKPYYRQCAPLGDYSTCHLAHHLEEVDYDAIRLDQAVEIVDGLFWLFGTRDGARYLVRSTNRFTSWFCRFPNFHKEFWESWVQTDRYLNVVQHWLGKIDCLKSLAVWSGDAISWMRAAAVSKHALLRPIMESTSKSWLCDGESTGWGPWLIHGWLTLVRLTSLSIPLRIFLNRLTLCPAEM